MTEEIELKLWQVLAEILSDKYNVEVEIKRKNPQLCG